MRDFLFYPLTALVAGGVIYYALSFAEEYEPIVLSEGFSVSGEQLQHMLIPEQLEFSLVTDEQTGEVVAVLKSHANKKSAPPSAGISVRLGADFEKIFNGKPLEMTVRARAGSSEATPLFEMGYFAVGGKSSDWQAFEPTPTYQDYTVRVEKSAPLDSAPVSYAGIWPDLEGFGRTLNISSITVKIAQSESETAN